MAIAIVALGIALQFVRVLQVQSSTGETPFFSANDRSRWCTIAALAIDGKYEIDKLLEMRDPLTKRRTWYTIDLVRHRGDDDQLHYYSSKPPLLPTLYAAVYWAVRATTGATLMKHTFYIARIMLILVNLIPLAVLWYIMARKAVRDHHTSYWAVIVLALFTAFGTFLSTFSNTLNNHLPAAVAAGISLWCLDRIIHRGQRTWYWFALCGLATSFTAANEMPALSWLVIVGALLFLVDVRRTLLAYVPALLPVAIGFFVTNYLAHGVWRPAYAHRDLGAKVFDLPVADGTLPSTVPMETLVAAFREQDLEISSSTVVRPARRRDVYELWDQTSRLRLGLRLDQPNRIGVYIWDDWYDYPGSYWVGDRKQGVDRGEPSSLVYAFHCLVGHHGIFSLTPFWWLSVGGVLAAWRHSQKQPLANPHFGLEPIRKGVRPSPERPQRQRNRLRFNGSNPFSDRLLVVAIVVTSLVCIGFYLARPLEDRNYGGVCSGLRWVFWMTPLWFWLVCDGLKSVKHFAGRRATEISLAISLFSVNYPWSNPWTHPWLMQLLQHWGWIHY